MTSDPTDSVAATEPSAPPAPHRAQDAQPAADAGERIIRGNLKIEISASKPTLVAGEQFSVFVVIENPYDIPVDIFSVVTQTPVEFIDVTSQPTDRHPREAHPQMTSRALPPPTAPEDDCGGVRLQPGDSIAHQFVFCTRRWLLFSPLIHRLQIQVRYGIDGVDHIDSIPFQLTIQAALTAMMIGAVLGGVGGGIARLLQTPMSSITVEQVIVSLTLAVILSTAVVVSFARKSGVQPIVSVEDFWGGVLIGFLIGYLGQQFADSIIRAGPGV